MVLGIQFADLPEFRSAHVGLLWQEIRHKYPKVQEVPPLPPIFETFGSNAAPGEFMFPLMGRPPYLRYWFEDAEGVHLFQLQQDRLLHNWRRQSSEHAYPGYEAAKTAFVEEVELFQSFLAKEKLGNIQPNQCEVTYINALIPADGKDLHAHPERASPLANHVDVGLKLEAAVIQNRYIITDGNQPSGRLYVNLTPALLAPTGQPNFQLEITARSKPEAATLQSAFELLDRQHDIIATAFDAVTMPELKGDLGERNG
jgi:uncharacterized protein (TIGR04255 family)